MALMLDHRGLLPAGVHDATLQEIEQGFVINPARQALWTRARQFLDFSLLPSLGGHTLILAGSFFSDKADPADIEATAIIEIMDGTALPLIHLYLTHDIIHRDFGVDFYPTIRAPGHNDFSLYFQYVGPKTGAAKNLHPRELRGVVKVT